MPLLRRDVLDLTQDEKNKYLNVLYKLKATTRPGSKTNIYDEHAILHRTVTLMLYQGQPSDVGHDAADFLPWHRAMLREWEMEVHKADPTVSILYWDWTNEASTNACFNDDFMGAWVQGVDMELRGPLAAWPQADNDLTTITSRRNYREKSVAEFIAKFRDTIKLHEMIEKYPDFVDFSKALTRAHIECHISVGGMKSDLMDLKYSGNDPVFFLLHGFVDYWWAVWQDRWTKFDGFRWHVPYKTDNIGVQGAQAFRVVDVGLNAGDLMWPWDQGRTGYSMESNKDETFISNFLSEIRRRPALTVASQWNYRTSGYGYEVQGEELFIGAPPVTFDLALRQSILFPFEVDHDFHHAPVTIKTTGEARLMMRLFGPAQCDNCYGPAIADDAGSGPEGPIINQVLTLGRYHLVIFPLNSQTDVGAFNVSITPIHAPGHPPFPPFVPRPGFGVPPFGGPPMGGPPFGHPPMGGPPFGGPPMGGPPFGGPPGRGGFGPAFRGRGVPRGGFPHPGMLHPHPHPGAPAPGPSVPAPPAPVALFKPPGFPVKVGRPATQVRPIPLELGKSMTLSHPIHGAAHAFQFSVTTAGRALITFTNVFQATANLQFRMATIASGSAFGVHTISINHQLTTPGTYDIVFYSMAGAIMQYTVLVQFQ